jgi:hypothetical protein
METEGAPTDWIEPSTNNYRKRGRYKTEMSPQ